MIYRSIEKELVRWNCQNREYRKWENWNDERDQTYGEY